MAELTKKDIIDLKIKLITPYVMVASKHDIEKDRIIEYVKEAWKFAIDPIMPKQEGITQEAPTE